MKSKFQSQDLEITRLIALEERRQKEQIRLIASENYVSEAVLKATGSVLTNKYSEGYPGRRYYEGQSYIDPIERLAIKRAKSLFSADHANVQPYSGSPANLAAYHALLDPHDLILSMSLPAGGHLTHGWKVSATGTFWNAVQYGVRREDQRIDYDEVRRLAHEHRPKLIVAGASAYPRTIDFPLFREIADEVGAYLMVDMAHISGLVAGGVHPSPVPYADVVTSTSHKTLRGPRGGFILSKKEHKKAIDRAVFPGLQGGPHNHTTAALAVALKEADTASFKLYAKAVVDNAKHLGEALVSLGFKLTTGGTDNHLMVVDVTPHGVGGGTMASALNQAGIVCNMNAIPFDERSPRDPSGIRLGTAAVTTRGFGPDEMEQIAEWVAEVAKNINNDARLARIAHEVRRLTREFAI